MLYPQFPNKRQWRNLVYLLLANDDLRGMDVCEYDHQITSTNCSNWKAQGLRKLGKLSEVEKIEAIEQARADFYAWQSHYGRAAKEQAKIELEKLENAAEEIEQFEVVTENRLEKLDCPEKSAKNGSNSELEKLEQPALPVDSSYKLLDILKKKRVENYLQELEKLELLQQKNSGKLAEESEQIDQLIQQVMAVSKKERDPKALNSLTQAYKRLIELRKSVIPSIYGSISVDKAKEPAVNKSQHLHLHNSGIKGFTG